MCPHLGSDAGLDWCSQSHGGQLFRRSRALPQSAPHSPTLPKYESCLHLICSHTHSHTHTHAHTLNSQAEPGPSAALHCTQKGTAPDGQLCFHHPGILGGTGAMGSPLHVVLGQGCCPGSPASRARGDISSTELFLTLSSPARWGRYVGVGAWIWT